MSKKVEFKRVEKYQNVILFNCKDHSNNLYKHLITKEEEEWLKTKQGLFFKACFENDIGEIKKLVQDIPISERMDFFQESTNTFIKLKRFIIDPNPVHICCMNDSKLALVILKSFFEDLDLKDDINESRGFTPILTSICFGSIDVFRYLIKDINVDPKKHEDYEDYSSLHLASICGHKEIVEHLIDKIEMRPDVVYDEDEKRDCLHLAAENGHLEIMKYLIREKGMQPRKMDGNNRNCAHIAAADGHVDILKFLLVKHGMSPRSLDYFKRNCLHLATFYGHLNVFKYLLENYEMDPDVKDGSNYNCLFLAAQSDHENIDILKYIVDAKELKYIDIKQKHSTFKRNIAHIATLNGNLNVLKYLEVIKFPLDEVDMYGKNCLHLCVESGIKKEIIKFLLENRVPLEKDNSGTTPLELAYRKNNKEHIEIIKNFIHNEIHIIEDTDNVYVNEINAKIEKIMQQYRDKRKRLKDKKQNFIEVLQKEKDGDEVDYERIDKILKEIEKLESYEKDVSKFFQDNNFIDFHHKLIDFDHDLEKLKKNKKVFEDKGVFKNNEKLEEEVVEEFKNPKTREIIRIDVTQDVELYKFLIFIKSKYYVKWQEWKNKEEETKVKVEKKIKEQLEIVKNIIKNVFDFFEDREGIIKDINVHLPKLQKEKKRSWFYLGELKNLEGNCRHGCLLFKLVCDFLGIKCRVYRGLSGKFLHNYNLIQLTNGRLYIVDTMNLENAEEPDIAVKILDLKSFNRITNFDKAHKEAPKYDSVKTFKLKEDCDTKLIKKDFYKEYEHNGMYEVKRKFIKSGGFGSIYHFPNVKVEKNEIVIKEINVQKISSRTGYGSKNVKKYIEKEIFLMNFLSHPNIIKIYNHFHIKNESKQDIYGILMKRYSFDGEKFIEHLKSYELEKQVIEFFVLLLKVSKGLKYLHDIAIIHLDLKPQNILIDFNDVDREIKEVVLTDFGSSKEKTRLFLHTFTFGTPKYCAPEIQDKKEYNEKADIFSFGKIMKDFSFCFEYWNKKLSTIMKKCLSKDKRSRPTMLQIIKALKNEFKIVKEKVKNKKLKEELKEAFFEKYGKENYINRKNFYEIQKEEEKKREIKEKNLLKPETNIEEEEEMEEDIIEEEEENQFITANIETITISSISDNFHRGYDIDKDEEEDEKDTEPELMETDIKRCDRYDVDAQDAILDYSSDEDEFFDNYSFIKE